MFNDRLRLIFLLLSCLLISFLWYFSLAQSVLAVMTGITTVPESISKDPFTVGVTVSGAAAGKNYLRVDLFKEGTKNYFGETYDGTSWYSESQGERYYPIDVQREATWSGVIQARVGNPTSGEYSGAGTYKIRIRRYTGAGNYNAEEANTSAKTIIIAISLPSPSPTHSVPGSAPSTSTSPTPQMILISSATPVQENLITSVPTQLLIAGPDDRGKKITSGVFESEDKMLASGEAPGESDSVPIKKLLPTSGAPAAVLGVSTSMGGVLVLLAGVLFVLSAFIIHKRRTPENRTI